LVDRGCRQPHGLDRDRWSRCPCRSDLGAAWKSHGVRRWVRSGRRATGGSAGHARWSPRERSRAPVRVQFTLT